MLIVAKDHGNIDPCFIEDFSDSVDCVSASLCATSSFL